MKRYSLWGFSDMVVLIVSITHPMLTWHFYQMQLPDSIFLGSFFFPSVRCCSIPVVKILGLTCGTVPTRCWSSGTWDPVPVPVNHIQTHIHRQGVMCSPSWGVNLIIMILFSFEGLGMHVLSLLICVGNAYAVALVCGCAVQNSQFPRPSLFLFITKAGNFSIP